MQKKKVLFLIDTLEIGGAERSISEIVSRFLKFVPVVLSLYEGNHLKEAYEKKGIEVIALDLPPETSRRKVLNLIQSKLEEIDPKIVHATLLRSCLLSRSLELPSGTKLINSLVNNTYSKQRYYTLKPLRAAKLFLMQIKDSLSAGKVDLFFSNSSTIKHTTSKALFIPKEKIIVIYRGRDSKIFYPKNRNNDIDVSVDGVIFTCVARLVHQKGQLDLIEAFNLFLKKYPNASLQLVGDGDLRKKLEIKINELGLTSKIKILGRRNDVPEILRDSDFFVFPSYYEGLPGSLIEALFSRKPIIASNIPENLECINSETSLIFERGNIGDLKNKMIKALNEKDWNTMTEKAYIFALENFSIDNIANQYELAYTNLLKRK